MNENPESPICPECFSTDTEDAGFTPMQGHVTECRDCGWVFPTDDVEGPTVEQEEASWGRTRHVAPRDTLVGMVGR